MPKKLNDFICYYSGSFKTELGIYEDGKIHLDIENNIRTIFHEPQQIPFALRKKVKPELVRLENEDVMEQVSHSNWGSPLVPALKANGKCR